MKSFKKNDVVVCINDRASYSDPNSPKSAALTKGKLYKVLLGGGDSIVILSDTLLEQSRDNSRFELYKTNKGYRSCLFL